MIMYRIRIEKLEEEYWKEENYSKRIVTELMIPNEMIRDSRIGDEKETLTYIFTTMLAQLDKETFKNIIK